MRLVSTRLPQQIRSQLPAALPRGSWRLWLRLCSLFCSEVCVDLTAAALLLRRG